MEFFELGIGRIHQLIADWFSFVINSGLYFAFFSLLLSLLIIYLLKKFKLLKRENNVRQALVKVNYIAIPVLFTLFGFLLGTTLSTKDFFTYETKKSITPLMRLVFPAYQNHVNTNWARVIQTRMSFNETLEEYVNEIEFKPRNENYKEIYATKAANFMVPRITKWGIESVVTSARDIALQKGEEQGFIETQKVKALMIVHTLNMFNYPKGLWDKTNAHLEVKTSTFFNGIAGNLVIIFILLLTIPIAEIASWHYFTKRNRKKTVVRMKSNQGLHADLDSLEIVEEVERVGGDKALSYRIDIEIPKVCEN